MKYFRSGNFVYGVVYSIWRGYIHIMNSLATLFYRIVLCPGPGTKFSQGFYISHPQKAHIGNGVYVGKNVHVVSEISPDGIWIEDNVQISDNSSIDFTGKVVIRSNALLSPSVKIITHDHGYDPHASPMSYGLEIGEHAWIGLDVIILPGVSKIGKYAIVGAGAIVTKPVPDYAIVAGNPAKVIKMRSDFSE